jgi:hypothetical protein
MHQEALNTSVEAITNPILQILIICLSIAVSGLTAAVVFMYRQWREDMKDRLEFNTEAIKALSDVANSLEGLNNQIVDFRNQVLTKILK